MRLQIGSQCFLVDVMEVEGDILVFVLLGLNYRIYVRGDRDRLQALFDYMVKYGYLMGNIEVEVE